MLQNSVQVTALENSLPEQPERCADQQMQEDPYRNLEAYIYVVKVSTAARDNTPGPSKTLTESKCTTIPIVFIACSCK